MADNPQRNREHRSAGDSNPRQDDQEDPRPQTRDKTRQKLPGEDLRVRPTQPAGNTRVTRSKSRNKGKPSTSTAVDGVMTEVIQAQTTAKGKGKQRAERKVEVEVEAESSESPPPETTNNAVGTATENRPAPSTNKKQTAAQATAATEEPEEQGPPEIIEIFNAGLKYLTNSRKQIKKYKTQREQKEGRLDDLEEMASEMPRAISVTVPRLGLSVEDERLLLMLFQGNSRYRDGRRRRHTT